MIRPIDIAKQLNISTSSLRHYESWGLIPEVERGSNGYRIYTDIHVAYFECIRAMIPSFGMDIIRYCFEKIDEKDIMSTILKINKAQHDLYEERAIAEKTIEILNSTSIDNIKLKRKDKLMTIGEISDETNTPATSIRHWEKSGLISPLRDSNNQYRVYNSIHLRKILLIRALKKSVYSLDILRAIIDKLDDDNIEESIKVVKDSLIHFDEVSKHQLKGCHAFYKLCNRLSLLD